LNRSDAQLEMKEEEEQGDVETDLHPKKEEYLKNYRDLMRKIVEGKISQYRCG